MNHPSLTVQAVRSLTGRPTGAWIPVILLAPAVTLTVLLFGGGLVLGLLQALGYTPGAERLTLGLNHFATVLGAPDFISSLLLTFYIATVSTVIAVLLSICLALTLVKMAGTSRLVHFLLQVPLTVPHLAIAVSVMLLLAPSGMISRLFQKLGMISSSADFPLLVNDPLCISILSVYVWKEIPFITFMILAVLKNMGTELLEAGATLKASRRQRFFYITLPIIGPSLGGAALIVFAFTFGAFEVPYLLGRTYPMALPVWAYRNYSDIDLLARPEGIAAGIIIAAVVVICIVLSSLILGLGRKQPWS